MEFQTKKIILKDGSKIYSRIVEKGAKYWLIGTHGIGEYLNRHDYLTSIFGADVNVLQYDLRGHGRSSGVRAYISDFDIYFQDLKEVIDYLHERFNATEYVLFGHSMGALITCGTIQKYGNKLTGLKGVIINAPPVGMPGVAGLITNKMPVEIFNYISRLKASVPIGGLVDANDLSHIREVGIDYRADELNILKLHLKLLLELIRYSKKVYSKEIGVSYPSFCSYGTDDKIVDVAMLEKYFTKIEMNFKLTPFKGAYHEIHNELDKYKLPYFKYLKNIVRTLLYDN